MKTRSITISEFDSSIPGGYKTNVKNNEKEQLEMYVVNLCNEFLKYKKKEEELKEHLDKILKEYQRLTSGISN